MKPHIDDKQEKNPKQERNQKQEANAEQIKKEKQGHRYQRIVGAGFRILALAITFFFILYRFEDLCGSIGKLFAILIPFVYGGIMAYLLRMPCNFFEKYLNKLLPQKLKKLSVNLAITLSLLASFLLLYLLVSMVVPQMAASIAVIVAALPDAVIQASEWLQARLENNPVLDNYIQTAVDSISQRLQVWAKGDLLPMLQNMVDGFASTVSTAAVFLTNLFIGVFVCIYTLSSRKQFARQAKAVVYSIFKPKWAEYILDEVSYADRMFVGFFSGKIVDSAIVGVLCYIFSLIFRFPNAMLVSVIVGITNIIPYFGPYIGAVPSFLLILIVDPVKSVWFLVFVIILQQFDGNILGPRLLANSTGLSGFWVLFSVTIFSGLFGFAGILTGVPVFAVIYDIIRKLVVYGLKRNNKLEVLQESADAVHSSESR